MVKRLTRANKQITQTRRGGKQAIDIKFITHNGKRKSTLEKRRKGAIKKLLELMILCEAEIDSLFRDPDTGEVYHVSNVRNVEEFRSEIEFLAHHNLPIFKRICDTDYCLGLDELKSLPKGMREKKKAGRHKKVDPIAERQKREDELAKLPPDQRNFELYVDHLKSKKYDTTTMRNQAFTYKEKRRSGTFDEMLLQGFERVADTERVVRPDYIRETTTITDTADNNTRHYQTNKVVEQVGPSQFVVTSNVNLTVQQLVDTSVNLLADIARQSTTAPYSFPTTQLETASDLIDEDFLLQLDNLDFGDIDLNDNLLATIPD